MTPVTALLRVAGLAVVWVALWGDPSAGTLAAGFLVGSLVVALFPREHPPRVSIRPVALVALGWYVFVNLATSTGRVVLAVLLGGERRVRPSVVSVPLETRSTTVATMTANLITITPGTMTVDESDFTLRVHVLGDVEPGSVQASVLDLERRVARAIRPSEGRP